MSWDAQMLSGSSEEKTRCKIPQLNSSAASFPHIHVLGASGLGLGCGPSVGEHWGHAGGTTTLHVPWAALFLLFFLTILPSYLALPSPFHLSLRADALGHTSTVTSLRESWDPPVESLTEFVQDAAWAHEDF